MDSKWTFALRGEGSDTLEIDIYDVIGESFWGDSVSAKDVRAKLKEAKSVSTIKLRVNSRGGDVIDGFAIYNLLNEHPARVEADIDALAASMASVVIMAADEIRIAKNAMVMIHNPWGMGIGGSEDMRSLADLLDKMTGQIADAYVARTGQSIEEVTAMMAAETWMTADEAKAKGFVDMVKTAKTGKAKTKAYASLDLTGFRHVPEILATAIADARAPQEATDASAKGGGAQMEKKMDLKELRAQHPDVYDAAVEEGVAKERKRCSAHIKMAGTTGATEVAHKAIASGASIQDDDVHADYMSAAINRRDRNEHQVESDGAAAAIAAAQPVVTSSTGPQTALDAAVNALWSDRAKKVVVNG